MDETDKGIDLAIKAINAAAVAEAKRLALRVVQVVVVATPVKTGRARGNWIMTEESPNTAVFDTKFDPSGQQTITDAAQVVKAAKEYLGLEFHLANNLPYIEPLNNGHSAQAPAGFVEKSVQVASGVLP